MNPPDLLTAAEDLRARADLNRWLAKLPAAERVAWAAQTTPGPHVLSSSFGATSAAALHLVTRALPGIPVVLIDTGYLFAETYRFADTLSERLGLNLKVYRPAIGIAWMEARHGRLWEQGLDGIERYNRLRKIEPMQRAMRELGAHSWFAGLRRSQSESRAAIDFIELKDDRWKLHPIADWTDRDVGHYLQRHDLPYHPLRDAGYLSIGDVHTTHRWEPGMSLDETRFFGLKRECGLHTEL
jgi:phosphoadenosine phosphosulfate reductase